jgi:hypothetical protein
MIDLLPATVLLSEPHSRSLGIEESTIKQISRSDESLSLRMVTTRGRRRHMLHTMDRPRERPELQTSSHTETRRFCIYSAKAAAYQMNK